MKKKRMILGISYGAAAVFVLSGLLFTAAGGAGEFRLSQDYEYRRAAAQLISSVSEMDSALSRGQYATGSGMSGQVCAELMSAAQSGATALSILPLETNALEEVAGFLSQMEEYARVKGAMACSGTGFDAKDRETFAALQKVTNGLVPALGELYQHLSEGGLRIRGWIAQDGLVTDEADSFFEDEILSVLEDFPEPPRLVYPGKLSADYDDTPSAVAKLQPVTQEQALAVARKLAGAVELTPMGLSQGKLPGYYFSGDTGHGAVTVTITQQGGLPELYLQEYSPGEPAVTDDEAKQAAQAFLQAAGYGELREEQAVREQGLLKLSYVYDDGAAAYLADAVEVVVTLDTATVVSLDASDYLRNHRRQARTAAPKLTWEAAAETAVPEGLQVVEQELVWYTGKTGETALCWRFVCSAPEDGRWAIYADSGSGQQIAIAPAGENVS